MEEAKEGDLIFLEYKDKDALQRESDKKYIGIWGKTKILKIIESENRLEKRIIFSKEELKLIEPPRPAELITKQQMLTMRELEL